ncbi:SulP family inorganic anion transporter [Halalkalibacter kiskunsagensis]|uniref:SulP family inorganic anion transporter n=1 Tax=Halalkalibacter kiskunsagensis TaxID=1548599 RepID=A0ABV6KDM1_9BACI
MKQPSLMPVFQQIKDYKLTYFRKDLFSAFMVSLLLIPQGMAYAILAGLPPVYGLYTAIFPAIMYGLFGLSRQLSVGPVAVISIMVFAGVAPLADPGTASYLAYVVFLTLLVGLVQMLMAVLRIGALMQFVPHSVIQGFTSALALTIILNQIGQLIGVSFARELPFFFAVIDFGEKLPTAHVNTMIFSLLLLIFYFISKRSKVLPPTLVFIVISTAIVIIFSLEQYMIKTVGVIPSGLPSFSIPLLIENQWINLIPLAFFIAVISFLESFVMASSLNEKIKDVLDPNQELFALGLANVFGSFFCSIPVAGAFSRSAVSAQSGARTSLNSLFATLFVILVLSYFTEGFVHLPLAALALMIIFAAKNLIDLPYNSLKNKQINNHDFILCMTFVSSLAFGLTYGILIGLVLSFISVWILKFRSSYRKE